MGRSSPSRTPRRSLPSAAVAWRSSLTAPSPCANGARRPLAGASPWRPMSVAISASRKRRSSSCSTRSTGGRSPFAVPISARARSLRHTSFTQIPRSGCRSRNPTRTVTASSAAPTLCLPRRAAVCTCGWATSCTAARRSLLAAPTSCAWSTRAPMCACSSRRRTCLFSAPPCYPRWRRRCTWTYRLRWSASAPCPAKSPSTSTRSARAFAWRRLRPTATSATSWLARRPISSILRALLPCPRPSAARVPRPPRAGSPSQARPSAPKSWGPCAMPVSRRGRRRLSSATSAWGTRSSRTPTTMRWATCSSAACPSSARSARSSPRPPSTASSATASRASPWGCRLRAT